MSTGGRAPRDGGSGSAAGRDDLVAALRGLVEAAGVVPAEVARRTGLSEATVSRYLNGRVLPSPDAVRRIVEALGRPASALADEALALAEDLRSGSASRVVVLRSSTATRQRRFAEIEAASGHVATFTCTLVPGLLQTKRYARAVFASAGRSGAEVQDAVRERVATRQGQLGDPERRYTQVMTEGALRWRVGSSDLMTEQVERIADLAGRESGDRVRIGIIPWSTVVDQFPLTNFDLYDDGRAVVVGTGFGTSFLDRPLDTEVFVRQFRALSGLAVFGTAAVPELRRIAAAHRDADRAPPGRS